MKESKVFNVDCMEYMKSLPDKAFDLAIVDPPYGIGADNHHGNSSNGWRQWEKKAWDCKTPKKEYFDELFRVSINQIVWGANYMTENIPPSMGWVFWDKGQRNFSLADGELAFTSFDRALRVFTYHRAKELNKKRIHPTQKPVALYEWLLMNYAKEGDRILDTHLGSGSSRIAAHKLGFEFVGCEIDKDYFEAQNERFKLETSQKTLF